MLCKQPAEIEEANVVTLTDFTFRQILHHLGFMHREINGVNYDVSFASWLSYI